MKIDEKQRIVQELHDRFTRSKVVIVTDYKGLDVAALSDLRRKLREAGAEYRVVKNTLLTRAAERTDVALIREHFKGPSAVATSEWDPVAPAKVLMSFAKENGKLAIKVGVMGRRVLDAGRVKALSDLPSREALLGQLLSVLNGVPTGFVRTLNAIPAKLLYALQAVKEQKEQTEAA